MVPGFNPFATTISVGAALQGVQMASAQAYQKGFADAKAAAELQAKLDADREAAVRQRALDAAAATASASASASASAAASKPAKPLRPIKSKESTGLLEEILSRTDILKRDCKVNPDAQRCAVKVHDLDISGIFQVPERKTGAASITSTSGNGSVNYDGIVANIFALNAAHAALEGRLSVTFETASTLQRQQLASYANVCRRFAHPELCRKEYPPETRQMFLAAELALRGYNKPLIVSGSA